MLKRTIVLFFISLLSICFINADSISDKSYFDEYYKNSVPTFFAEGEIEFNEIVTVFAVYKEKNKFNHYNLSIKIDNKIYKIVANETTDLFYIDKTKVTDKDFFYSLPIPLNVLNNALRNRDYILLEKSSRFKFKNIRSNKISVLNKVVEITNDITDSTVLKVSSINEENPVDEIIPEASNYNITKDVKKIVPIKENIYSQIDYIISANTPVILKKEFYLTKKSRIPLYIYETNKINYINGHYTETEWMLTNTKTDESIIFRYNIQSILYNKQDVSKEFGSMISFYGVK
ncbi:MAG: hypothetical protein OCD02_23395 [Spirochaetaceae bacterium]